MTTTGWAAVLFGVTIAAGILGACVYDVHAVWTNQQTISQWCWVTSRQYPLLPASVGLFLGLVCGGLLAHLFL